MIRNVLALDDHDPICGQCATALGGTPNGRSPVYACVCRCCGNISECRAVDQHTWPASLIRPEPRHARKPWRQPDDYSEIEGLLGGRREP